MYVHDTQQRYRVSDDFDLEGYKNDDHSLTYSSADSSIDGEEDASIFTLDGMMIDQHESENHFISNDIGISSPSSFVEMEQSIHKLAQSPNGNIEWRGIMPSIC